MTIHTGIVVFTLFLIGVLIGYIAGKHTGARTSKTRAQAAVALELRQQLLRHGVCPTCDRSTEDMVQYGTKG